MAYNDYLSTQDPALASLQSGGLPTYGPTAQNDPLAPEPTSTSSSDLIAQSALGLPVSNPVTNYSVAGSNTTTTVPAYTPPPTINSTTISPQANLSSQIVYPEITPPTLPTPEPAPTVVPSNPLDASIQSLIDQTTQENNQLVGESAYRTSQEAAYNIPELTKTQNDLRAQQQAILNEQTQIQLNAPQSGQGGVSTVIASSKYNALLRENAIKALGISSLLAASNGNLSYAQSLVDRAVAAKFDPIKAQIDANLKNLDLILKSPDYTNAEKARAQAQVDLQNAKARTLALQEAGQKEIWNVATTAASNGANFTPTAQYPSLALTLNAISTAPSKEQALQIASITGLLSSPTTSTSSTSAPKILGNATTGYFSYDATTGQTTPVANPTPTQIASATNAPISSTSPSPTSPATSTYKFTSTQLNTGAAKAALSLDQFKALNPDVQNFYIHATTANLSDLNGALTQVKSGSVSVEDAKNEIASLPLSTAVKDYFNSLIDKAKPTTTTSKFVWWNPLTWF